MAVKNEKLPQIRVTSSQKEQIYKFAEDEGLKFSEFALKRLLNNQNDSFISKNDYESKLYKLIYYYEKKKQESDNPLERHKFNMKINNIMDIIHDIDKLDL